jgi:hypothetical protein
MVQLLWKAVWWFLKKLNIDLPCDSANSFLGMCQRIENKDSNRYFYANVHHSTIHHSQVVENNPSDYELRDKNCTDVYKKE